MKEEDRRYSRRYDLKIPLEIKIPDSQDSSIQEAESQDISGRGMNFISALPLKAGTILQILLRMPEEIVRKSVGAWRCHCRVVHVRENQPPDGRLRAGVEIQYYEIVKRT
ncbi:MAG: PilZ domain-containing protein [Candidatus Acidiferrales bacterium]